MLEQYKAIIFDMDGTLVDSGKVHEIAWTETLEEYGIPVDRALMRSLAGVPTKETINILLDHFNIESAVGLDQMNAYKEAVVKTLLKSHVKPTALADQVHKYYQRKPMSIGTGAYTAEAELILELCGLTQYVGPIVGADQVKSPKPAPDTFLLCAQLMGVDPAECVVLEDSKLGLQAAKDAGMVGIDVLETFGITNDYFL